MAPEKPENLKDRTQRAAQERKAATGGEVAVPDGRADLARQILDPIADEVAKQLPKLIDADAFMRTALTGMKSSKQARALIEADRPSLYAALLEAARLGLMPFTDEGAIVVFGKQATFIPQWQGYVQLFYRTGQVARVVRNLIYQADAWDLSYGDDGGFYHKPNLVNRETGEPVDRGKPILAYCYLVMRDGARTEVTTVTRWEAEDTMRRYSRSWQNAEKRWADSNGKTGRDSVWHTDFPSQWLKTAVRRHASIAPKSPELVQLLLMDRRDDSRPEVAALAPPPPVLPPLPPADEGVDWTTDVNGTVPGTVVPPDDAPPGGEAGEGKP